MLRILLMDPLSPDISARASTVWSGAQSRLSEGCTDTRRAPYANTSRRISPGRYLRTRIAKRRMKCGSRIIPSHSENQPGLDGERGSLRKLAADIYGVALGLDEHPPITRVVLEAERQDFRSKRADLLGGKIHYAADKRVQKFFFRV